MNQFIIHPTRLTPDQIVRGTLGISIIQLIEEIRENRNGKYDYLYKTQAAPASPGVRT